MFHFDINNYNLEGKGVNQLAFLLYQTQNDSNLVNQLVSRFSLENLIKTKNNGLISNLLLYYISTNDIEKIEKIISLGSIYDFNMMKRDYLNLAKYFYPIDINISIKYFNHIFSLVSTNTDSVILSKDVDFLIENKMFSLISLISGLFIESSINSYPLVNGNERELKLKMIDSKIIDNIKDYVEKIIGTESVKKLNQFVKTQMTNFDTIIDGGNVLHARTGLIGPSSLNDLKKLIELVKKEVGNPLLVIHRRHLKTLPNLISHLNAMKISYYLTPYNMNDDIFILWFFLNYGSVPYIISNDQYRDHIFKFETSKKGKMVESTKSQLDNNFSQFNYILHQQTLKYNLVQLSIDSQPTYSRCIQQENNRIYIPHLSGKFIELVIL
jgi:hypothetical protein